MPEVAVYNYIGYIFRGYTPVICVSIHVSYPEVLYHPNADTETYTHLQFA